ncbi:hypothetical protein ACWFMI_23275 [Nocardiopsis terrae]|uniref:hypothetical protein n=1 Tax=Streptomyces sp. NPDC057554 TaxID=3350538 RepID=UPI0036C2ED70
MPGFNRPSATPTDLLASAARQAGLTLHHRGGYLVLSRFGSRIGIREHQGQWWLHRPDTEDLGPFTGEAELMRAGAQELDAARARSRESLVRGR